MLLQNTIAESLKSCCPLCDIKINVSNNYASITVVGEMFKEWSAVKRHQIVYKGLAELIASGELHAVDLKLYTPSEYAAINSE